MPIEVLVAVFIVVALIAIAVRFVPRDGRGRAQLPAIVDQSVGMWAIRQVVGQPDDPDAEVPETFAVQPTFEEIAYRIGVAGATKPILRMIPPPSAVGRSASAGPVADPVRRIRSRPGAKAGLGLQRRVAAVFACILAVGIAAVVAISQPSGEGAVLGATGTPAAGTPTAATRSGDSGAPADSVPAEIP